MQLKKLFFIGLVAVAQLANAHEFKRANTFEEAHDAVCRISVSGARGTAFFIGTSGAAAYFLTNKHVVENNKRAVLDFWNNGERQSIGGVVDWKAYDANLPGDFARVIVDAVALAAINPPWIAIGGRDAAPSVGAMIISCGAPDGRFTQAWKGQILEYYNGKTAIFSPPPVPGQSGSPICEYINGELFVTGVLTWLIGDRGDDNSKGGAIPISNLYKMLERRGGVNVDYHDTNASPIPPNATECAETNAKTPCVIEFTQDNCPPCVDAKKDVEALRARGARVYVYDVATERGAEYAERYGVDRTPSFVVLGDNYSKIDQIDGAGRFGEIWGVLERLTRNEQKAPKTDPETPPKPAETPAPLTIDPPRVDFRARPTVYEYPDSVGIFEDSERRWRNRGGGGRNDEPRVDDTDGATIPPPETPKQRPQIGERLTDRAVELIAGRVQRVIDDKVSTTKTNLRGKWDALKWRLFVMFCAVMVVIILIASAVISLFKRALQIIVNNYRELKFVLDKYRKENKAE